MDIPSLQDLPARVREVIEPSHAAAHSLQALASAFLLQLETDATAPGFVRDIFSNIDDILYHLHDAQVCFLPGLLELLVTGTPPSAQNFLWTSLPLKKGYGLYVLVLMKWVRHQTTGEYYWDYRLYLGSGTGATSGIVSRFHDYDREERYATNVGDAIHFGWRIAHRCIIAWAPQVDKARHFQLRSLFLTLEATLSHVFAFHEHDQMKSMEKSYWDPAILDYSGLCLGSSLREIYMFQGFLQLTEEEVRVELDALQQRAKLYRKEYLQRPEVKAMRRELQREYRQRPEVAEKKLVQAKVYDAKWREKPENKAKKAVRDKKYALTPKAKEGRRAANKRYLQRPGAKEKRAATQRAYREKRKAVM